MLASALSYYSEQQRLTTLAVRHLGRQSSMQRVLRLLALYQTESATLAVGYGGTALQEQGVSPEGQTVNPAAFTVTPGAPSVLDDIETDFQFQRIVASLVPDAGRSAMGAFTSTRSQQMGHIRQLNAPSCSRCAVLAGRWYRWSDGFLRHPRCDCVMVPAPRSAGLPDPYAAFERGQITDLTKAQTRAIQDGADISQVVNASREMQVVNFAGRRVQVTTAGTTSRGLAYRALSARGTTTRQYITGTRPVVRVVARAPRLSPEAIYNIANDSREEAIRLLRINGYIF